MISSVLLCCCSCCCVPTVSISSAATVVCVTTLPLDILSLISKSCEQNFIIFCNSNNCYYIYFAILLLYHLKFSKKRQEKLFYKSVIIVEQVKVVCAVVLFLSVLLPFVVQLFMLRHEKYCHNNCSACSKCMGGYSYDCAI